MIPANLTSRREFLKTSGTAVAGAALAATLAAPRAGYCAEDNSIKVALVGCGGRGTGAAANSLSTKGPVMLWAMADVFEHRLEGSHSSLSPEHTSTPGIARWSFEAIPISRAIAVAVCG